MQLRTCSPIDIITVHPSAHDLVLMNVTAQRTAAFKRAPCSACMAAHGCSSHGAMQARITAAVATDFPMSV